MDGSLSTSEMSFASFILVLFLYLFTFADFRHQEDQQRLKYMNVRGSSIGNMYLWL